MSLNEKYKKTHKPAAQGTTKYKQGYYRPVNPEKCLTPDSNIYRSGYELKFLQYCDYSPSIVRWASEPIAIPYKNPLSNLKYCFKNNIDPSDRRFWKTNNYMVDFWIEVPDGFGGVRRILIEIKPEDQTKKPKRPKEGSKPATYKKYNQDCMTFLQNNEKWKAAIEFCQNNGCEFRIFTERHLSKLKDSQSIYQVLEMPVYQP